MRNFVVAIDGPAGSGKSSISKIVAKKLGFTHLDTGAMYRAVTLEALRRGIDLENEDEYDFLDEISIIYKDDKIYLNGTDVSKEIRTEDVTNNVSTPSKLKRVRDKMVFFQRKSCEYGKVLMDGRDIGTVVMPNADLKIFLTASAEERAKRRCLENSLVGIESDYETILREIKERDFKDSTREIAPLKKASDAIEIDTTSLTIDEVVNKIINLIDGRLYSMENFDFEMPKELNVHDVVEGEVVSIEDNTIYLDVKQFTEAVMHLDHYTTDKNATSFKNLVKVGDKIKCQVTKITEEHIFVSRLNQLSEENFKAVIALSQEKSKVKVTVKKDVNKGFMVDYNGNQIFMPASLAGKDTKVGDKIEVVILPSEDENKKPIASRKAVLDEEYNQAKNAELDKVNVGDVVEATVAKVEKYGAFLRFGMLQGLLRAKEYSHKFVDITKEIKEGDKFQVKVIKKDDNNKLEFSRKALIDTPYQAFVKTHKVSDKVVGKVVEKTGFGLILEVAEDVRGLLHKSEYSHNPNDNLASVLKIGDTVEVAIIGLVDEKEKVSLSRKALMDNPWERVDAKVGDVVDVKVLEVSESGLKVETLGVDGFVPASEALVEKKNDLSSYFAVGDEAKAVITEINPKEWRLKLSIRKHQEAEARKDFEKYLNEGEEANSNLGDMFKDVLDK